MAEFQPDYKGIEKIATDHPAVKKAIKEVTEKGIRMAKADAPKDSGKYASMIISEYGESVSSRHARFTGWIRATAPYSAGVEYPSPLPNDRGLYVLTKVAQRLKGK